jgi:hypothetical protein
MELSAKEKVENPEENSLSEMKMSVKRKIYVMIRLFSAGIKALSR